MSKKKDEPVVARLDQPTPGSSFDEDKPVRTEADIPAPSVAEQEAGLRRPEDVADMPKKDDLSLSKKELGVVRLVLASAPIPEMDRLAVAEHFARLLELDDDDRNDLVPAVRG